VRIPSKLDRARSPAHALRPNCILVWQEHYARNRPFLALRNVILHVVPTQKSLASESPSRRHQPSPKSLKRVAWHNSNNSLRCHPALQVMRQCSIRYQDEQRRSNHNRFQSYKCGCEHPSTPTSHTVAGFATHSTPAHRPHRSRHQIGPRFRSHCQHAGHECHHLRHRRPWHWSSSGAARDRSEPLDDDDTGKQLGALAHTACWIAYSASFLDVRSFAFIIVNLSLVLL
jgi:hypothetical protein